MNTTTCKNCNNTISKEADVCPKCNTPTYTPAKIYAECRVCGEKLLRDSYRTMCTVLGNRHVEKGNKWGGAFCYIKHTPCPKCGDPQPLKCFWDTIVAQVLLFLMVSLGGIVSFMCFLALAGFTGTDYSHEEFVTRRVVAAVFMVLYLATIFLINRWRSKGIPSVNTGYVLTAIILGIVGLSLWT